MSEDTEIEETTDSTHGKIKPHWMHDSVANLLVRPIRSALFVDFDNIYSNLDNEVDEATALSFGNSPTRWLAWLEHQLPTYAPYDLLTIPELDIQMPMRGRPVRRMLWRRVYMNPDRYRHFRGGLVAAGIEVIDCPVLTGYGKTAADMIMALGILDALKQEPAVEEFIILAADADYTPVVQRLRKYDRRSIVLPIGGVSPAYKSAADQVLDANKFMDFLSPGFPASKLANEQPSTYTRKTDGIASEATGVSGSMRSSETKRQEIRAFLIEMLEANGGRMNLPTAGKEVLHRFSDYPEGDTLKGMLSKLEGSDLRTYKDERGTVYVYNPELYNVVDADSVGYDNGAADLFPERPELNMLVRRVTNGTGAPHLTTYQYKNIFHSIAEEVNANGYHLTHTSREGRNRCHADGNIIARADIAFVLQGIYRAGHNFSGVQDETTMATAFKSNLIKWCGRNQIALSEDDLKLLNEWLGFNEPTTG